MFVQPPNVSFFRNILHHATELTGGFYWHRYHVVLQAQRYVVANGVIIARDEGMPQGGPLSPLLANVLLDEVDRALQQRGHRFARYADDCNVYAKIADCHQDALHKAIRKLINENQLFASYPLK